MCGIAGFVGLDDEQLLRAMCNSLEHRGPDDEGYFQQPGVGLAMRRLAIIDLETGRQPISNETKDVHVVFNGEIYNYQELTDRLKKSGHRFSTASDTETIAHLYEEEGLDFVKSLRGMYAIALWDARRRRLVLARDRIGEKPLFYAERDGTLLFGSEIKAILQAKGSRSVNPQAVCEFLAAGYVAAPGTFFREIHKLAPGELLVHEAGRITMHRPHAREDRPRSTLTFAAAADQLADELSETVRLCLKSDVEVGAFLSGGLDSSVLVALMRKHEAKVQTFSVGYTGAAVGFQELSYAKRVAHDLGTEHHELILTAQSTMELLPRILGHYDEPHGEPTSVLVYLLSEFTRQHVKVAVGGTGGDEIFFGYPRHVGIRLLQYYRLAPRFVRENLLERVVLKWPESTRGQRFSKRAKRFIKSGGLPPEEAYLSWVSLLHPEVRDTLLSDQIRGDADDPTGEAFLRAHLTGPGDGDLMDRAGDLDVNGYLPEYQLAYMDRMSMAHGLEVRSPFCDCRLVDFVTSLPNRYRLRRTHTKHILKTIATRWIPKEIAERKKVGFDSPIGQWFKDDLRDFVVSFLAPQQLKRSGLLNPAGVQAVIADHMSGRRDYSLQLWSLLALEAWYRMYIEDGVNDAKDYELSSLRGARPADRIRHGGWGGASPQDNGRSDAPARAPLRRVAGTRKRIWDRMPPTLKTCFRPIVGAFPPQTLLGKDFRRWHSFAKKTEAWDQERTREYQLAEVRRMVSLAYEKTRFYRESFDGVGFNPGDLKRLEDMRHLPTIDRSTIREHLEEMCAVPPSAPGVDYVSTGGTGGEPLTFYIGSDRSAIEYAYLIASWERTGYRLGVPLAVLRGRIVAKNLRGLRHEYDPILRHHHYSAFHMTDENMGRYLDHIGGLGPCFLHVYPSSAALLARFLRSTGARPPANIRGIIAESEILYPDQRRFVEEVLECRFFSCYGQTEKLVAAAECEHSANYHVWPAYGYFELLDDEGNVITEPGQRGEIVGTGFINRVVPFVRYRTGDRATLVGDRCEACGRQQTVIADIRGHRTQEMLVAGDGSMISWTALNMHDDTFANVRQFQFYQDTPGMALLRIVPAEGFGRQDEKRILKNLERKLDQRVRLTITMTDAIPHSHRGKAIYVNQKIPGAGK